MDQQNGLIKSNAVRKGELEASLRRIEEVDWDFTAQASESSFSAVHWHPCRFPSQIPAISIGRFTTVGDMVLDPFMGSATTLVEAQRLGRHSAGIDINPVSCLLAEAKTAVERADAILCCANAIKLDIATGWDRFEPAHLPPDVQGEKWYMPSTLYGLRMLWGIVERSSGLSQVLTRACFSSILLPACREDRHWGYVCDNTQPKALKEPNALSLFLASLSRLTAAYVARDAKGPGSWPKARIVEGDAHSVLQTFPSEQVDCVITSPPYFGVADYVKAQRLTMEWLEEPIEPRRRQEIGARSKRHRLDAMESYIADLKLVFAQIHRVLKKGKFAVIVFGQSPSRGDAQSKFEDDLKNMGFTIEMKRLRNVPNGRRQMPSVVQETVFLLRK